jgi:acyl-CoA reductase-like NAD-dependent aldehyde dehydrogenase
VVLTSTVQTELDKFLGQDPVPLFIGGVWRTARAGEVIDVRQPADGGPLAKVACGDKAEIDDAVAAANRAFPAWSEMAPADRATLLHRYADAIEDHVELLAQLESLDVGKPVTGAVDFDIPFAVEGFRYFADLSVHIRRSTPLPVAHIEARQIQVPYGPCGFIFPWNFPFLLFAWGIAPALAAGNTVVVKPAELTPLTSLYACHLAEEVGIPAGVINVVAGLGHTAGAALGRNTDIRRMSFTGSPEVGREVAAESGRNLIPCKLELGGKGAAVVFNDVDISATARKLANAITGNAGQVCCTATRWLVHESVVDELVAEAKNVLAEVVIGAGTDPATTMGPLVSETQRRRVLSYIDKGLATGATALLEGGPIGPAGHEEGYFVKPALLAGGPDNICAREEIFGPVAYIIPFHDEDEAVTTVNRSRYGLANSVWSADLNRAERVAERLVAGNTWVNAHNVFAYGLPYAGVNLSGNGGGVNSPETLMDYLRPQTIARPLP